MVVDLLKKSRSLAIASMLALASVAAVGCAGENAEADESSEEPGPSVEDITQVDHTAVKRQSIGNCWLYATSTWLEALNKSATGTAQNTSESWLTYWHWFEQLANGRRGTEISTGGSFSTAVGLITRYGIVLEADFIPSEADAEMSSRQSSALATINSALKSGTMNDMIARRDRKAIRAELDRAWGLDEAAIKRIDSVFGQGVTRTLDVSRTAKSRAASNKVIPASAFPASLKQLNGDKSVGTLADAIGTKGMSWYSAREGKYAWNEAYYPDDDGERREFWKRVQRALHDGQPVVMSWKVDFNALSRSSMFSLAELQKRGSGSQGGHMTVMHDYQAEVPGVGLLKAGESATKEQMDKALDDKTKIEFVRVKNSWGGIRPDRWDSSVLPGYHDLEMAYLNGPIKECETTPSGTTDTTKCFRDVTPLWDVVLPAGY